MILMIASFRMLMTMMTMTTLMTTTMVMMTMMKTAGDDVESRQG